MYDCTVCTYVIGLSDYHDSLGLLMNRMTDHVFDYRILASLLDAYYTYIATGYYTYVFI